MLAGSALLRDVAFVLEIVGAKDHAYLKGLRDTADAFEKLTAENAAMTQLLLEIYFALEVDYWFRKSRDVVSDLREMLAPDIDEDDFDEMLANRGYRRNADNEYEKIDVEDDDE